MVHPLLKKHWIRPCIWLWKLRDSTFESWWYLAITGIERSCVGYEEFCGSKSGRWLTPSEICWILHILKRAEFNNFFFIYSKYFQTLKGENELFVFLLTKNNSTSSPSFSVNGSIICSGLHFWRHYDVIGLIICSGLHFWCYRFNMTKFFRNLVNSSWLWWIMRVVFANQKRGNILNE